MLCIQNNNTNPYFNLASEEYILRNFTNNCFMLYRNTPSIIIGKHQNTLAEINYEFVKNNNIDVIRRLSGGGTVFHDLGNLNFTFIQNAEREDNLVDFKKYTKPIIEVLQDLGIDAKFEGRNDIMINGKKISGNAEHVYKKRVLHHGTLLFSSELKDLSGALNVNPLKYSDKGVKSVRSRVTNISDHLKEEISVKEFSDRIFSHIRSTNKKARIYQFNHTDIKRINKLVSDKFSTWEWNYGYSPKYIFEKTILAGNKKLEVKLNVEKGIIKKVEFLGDLFENDHLIEIKELLINVEHKESSILKSLQLTFNKIPNKNIQLKDFVRALF